MKFSETMKFFSFLLFSLIFTFSKTSQACHRMDRITLLDFKAKIRYDPTKDLSTWNRSTDCCKWGGINCDPDTGRVDMLLLSDNQIKGSIPGSVSKLVSLHSLDLSNNKLTGSLPKSIGKLHSLTWVNLENNKLTGRIPSSIGKLEKLIELLLFNNHISGKIPSSIGNLWNLRKLNISKNLLSAPLPHQLGKLNSLQTLDLSFNPLGLVSIPNWLSKLENLYELMLAGTGLTGQLPSWSSSPFYQMVTLDLSSNRLTGELPQWICRTLNLVFLNLSNNAFHSVIPEDFTSLSSLVDADLHSNNFTGDTEAVFSKLTLPDRGAGFYNSIDLSNNMFSSIFEYIGNQEAMQSVKKLVLSNNPFGGSIPISLTELKEIQTLKLKNNGFSGIIPVELSNTKDLNSIDLSHNKLTGGIPSDILNLAKLEEFDVSFNQLSGKIPPHKAKIPASSFEGNSGLCDNPLPPCKTA